MPTSRFSSDSTRSPNNPHTPSPPPSSDPARGVRNGAKVSAQAAPAAGGDQDSAHRSLHGLAGTHPRQQPAPSPRHADQIGAGVGGPGHRQHQHHRPHPQAVGRPGQPGQLPQQNQVTAQPADVEDAQHRNGNMVRGMRDVPAKQLEDHDQQQRQGEQQRDGGTAPIDVPADRQSAQDTDRPVRPIALGHHHRVELAQAQEDDQADQQEKMHAAPPGDRKQAGHADQADHHPRHEAGAAIAPPG